MSLEKISKELGYKNSDHSPLARVRRWPYIDIAVEELVRTYPFWENRTLRGFPKKDGSGFQREAP